MFRPEGLHGAEALPPTTVLWGAADATHAATERQAVCDLLPAARYVELPDAGHYPDIEAPAHHAALLLD
jgi:pimeloyl-ACP methyl ester carboxylesterase